MSDFHKLSRAALQQEMLERLSEAAELRKESKHHRAELDRIRNRLDALKFEIGLIERELKRANTQNATKQPLR
jgi:predicted nuclease with TOPRIM domain